MKIPRHSQSQGFEKARQGIRAFSQSGEIPSLEGTGTRALEAWFLGPKAENADELERLIVEAIRDQAFWRRNFHPGDPGQPHENFESPTHQGNKKLVSKNT